VSVAAQTPDEARIAERYLSVLADVSRCAEALRDGDWRQLADTADDLCRRAALLAEIAGNSGPPQRARAATSWPPWSPPATTAHWPPDSCTRRAQPPSPRLL
jgi:hypothetical protein